MTLERLIRVAQTALEGSEADLGHVTGADPPAGGPRPEQHHDADAHDRHRGRILRIRFPTERLPELHTVGDVVAVIEELLHAPA